MSIAVDDEVALPCLNVDLGPQVDTSDRVRELVALHVAATLVPQASVTQREQIRASWHAALLVVWDAVPDWALAYVPGYHHGDNETFAVRKDTGLVVGGACPLTGQAAGESTADWLARLTG